MVELPSAALIADRLAQECDFFSIGTNDLIQYTIGIDRQNKDVAYLYKPLHLAVLRMLKGICDAAQRGRHARSRCAARWPASRSTPWCSSGSACRELSMNGPSIPLVKRIVRARAGGGRRGRSSSGSSASRWPTTSSARSAPR